LTNVLAENFAAGVEKDRRKPKFSKSIGEPEALEEYSAKYVVLADDEFLRCRRTKWLAQLKFRLASSRRLGAAAFSFENNSGLMKLG